MPSLNRTMRRAFFGHDKQVEKKALAGCDKHTDIKEIRGIPVEVTLEITIMNLKAAHTHFRSYKVLSLNYMKWTESYLNNLFISLVDNEEFSTKEAERLCIERNKQSLTAGAKRQLSVFSGLQGIRVESVDFKLLDNA